MNETLPPDEEREKNVRFVTEVMLFLGRVQTEISCALVLDPKINLKLQKQLKMSEEQMEQAMDAVALAVIGISPLATMVRSSMFGRIMALHSNITGNPEMHEILEEVNRRIMDRVIEDHH